VGYPGGKIHPFPVVCAFWRFSDPGAATEMQLHEQWPSKSVTSGCGGARIPTSLSGGTSVGRASMAAEAAAVEK